MTLTVETGAGILLANGYCTVSFADNYLTARGRLTENRWSAKSATQKGELIIAGTDYIERAWGEWFRGVREFSFDAVSATATITVRRFKRRAYRCLPQPPRPSSLIRCSSYASAIRRPLSAATSPHLPKQCAARVVQFVAQPRHFGRISQIVVDQRLRPSTPKLMKAA